MMSSSFSRVTVESLLNDPPSNSDAFSSSPGSSDKLPSADALKEHPPTPLELKPDTQCPPSLEVKRIPPPLSDSYKLSPYYTPAGSINPSPSNVPPNKPSIVPGQVKSSASSNTPPSTTRTPVDQFSSNSTTERSVRSPSHESDNSDNNESTDQLGSSAPQARSFHVFTRDTYDLMVWSLLQGRGPDSYTISHACGAVKMTTKRWNRLQGNLRINVVSPPGQADGLVYGKVVHPLTSPTQKDLWVNAVATNLLKAPLTRSLELRLVWRTCKRNLPIVPEEHWIDVFRAVHVRIDPDGREFHLRQAECIRMITSHYQTRRSRSGITNTVIREFFSQCGCHEQPGSSTNSSVSQTTTNRDKPSNITPPASAHLRDEHARPTSSEHFQQPQQQVPFPINTHSLSILNPTMQISPTSHYHHHHHQPLSPHRHPRRYSIGSFSAPSNRQEFGLQYHHQQQQQQQFYRPQRPPPPPSIQPPPPGTFSANPSPHSAPHSAGYSSVYAPRHYDRR